MSTPTKSDIEKAHERIQPYIHRTPVLTCESLNSMVGGELFFKPENFQKVGAFKMRGAANAVFSTPKDQRTRGFACHSSGNHGQAVARASQLAGVPAYIVMPKNSNKVKINAVKGYGAEVILCEPNDASRQSTCDEVVEGTGAQFVHPFDDYRIITGQATASKELIEDVEHLDFLTCPIGGGGLCAGTSLSAKYFGTNIQVIGSEPENVNDAFLSFQKGEIDPGHPKPTLADGLRTCVGEKTFAIIKDNVTDVLTVTEEEMIDAMKLVWERMKILIEPSCAVPFASILKHKERFAGKRTGIILTGGNVDLNNLPF